MKMKVTKHVANHHTNNDYYCLVVHFMNDDRHFRFETRQLTDGISIANWLPKDSEIRDILKARLKLEGANEMMDYIKGLLKDDGWSIKKQRGLK